ncbi:MAG: alpha/beta hydrolase [Candidatus Obscuribacterales bacterium]
MKRLDIKKLWRALIVVLTLATVPLVGLYFYGAPRLNRELAGRIMFHPPDRSANYPITINGVLAKHGKIIEGRDKTLTDAADKPSVELDSILFQLPKDKERGIILYSQGVGSSINYLCDPFQIATMLKLGYSVLVYDQEGYGLSSGKCNIDRWVPDTVLAHDYLVNELKYPLGSVIAYGESFGAGATSELSKRRPLKAMILESPFTSPKDWADQQLTITTIYPEFLFMEPTFNNLAMLKGKHAPVLVIGTALDKQVPISHCQRLAREATQPFQYLELPTSVHVRVSDGDRPAFEKQLKLFLGQFAATKQNP